MRDFREARYPASQLGAAIETVCADLETWEPTAATYDVVVLVFLHLPPPIRRAVYRRLVTSLRPGGLLDLRVTEAELDPDEGPYHQGRARLVRCVGRAP
jgi:trans-aconitate methyltransferase